MSSFVRDLRFAVRSILRKPSVAIVIVITLALGIGANAAIFSVVDALILRPFPIPDIDRLVGIWETIPNREFSRGTSPANFLDWGSQTEMLEELVAYDWWDANLTGGDRPERVQGTLVTPGFLDLLGVEPVLGRTLGPDREDFGARTVVLSHALWSRRFAADPGVLGASVLLDGERYDVVGVAAEGFDYPFGAEVWAPLWLDPEDAEVRDRPYLDVIGRLAPGATVEDAQAELGLLAERLEAQYPEANKGHGVRVMALSRSVVDIGVPALLTVWQSAAVFVLLIACVNVANLLLARGADRQRELSLQLAIGAGRARLVRALLTENVLLSMLGAAAAMPLAYAGVELLRTNMPAHIARFVVGWDRIDLDWHVLLFTGALAVLTALLFGIVPALRASRLDLASAMKEGGRTGVEGGSRGRGGRALVVIEVALALMLLVASGLSVRSTLRMLTADQGFDPDGLMAFQVALPDKPYQEPEKRRQFYDDVLRGVRGLPQVLSADVVNVLPSSANNTTLSVEAEGEPLPEESDRPRADFRVITPGYFETLRIPLLTGRLFDEGDREDTRAVAIVSESLAERLWAEADPLGRRFRDTRDGAGWLTVVGVSGDVLHNWFLRDRKPTYYVPMAQWPRRNMMLAARTRGEPEAIAGAVRAVVQRVDADQPVYRVQTMRRMVSERLIGMSYAASIMGVFGTIAFVLAAVGIYGVMSYSVSRRTHEIGLRMALGAGRRDVLRLTLGQTAAITTVGILVGLFLAYGAARLLVSVMFGVVTLEAAPFVALALTLGLVSIVAGYVPARRALGVDPSVALRVE